MIIRQQEAQRNLRQPAKLRQRHLGALEAIDDCTDQQRQQRPGNPHACLRHHAKDHFALVLGHIWHQAHQL